MGLNFIIDGIKARLSASERRALIRDKSVDVMKIISENKGTKVSLSDRVDILDKSMVELRLLIKNELADARFRVSEAEDAELTMENMFNRNAYKIKTDHVTEEVFKEAKAELIKEQFKS